MRPMAVLINFKICDNAEECGGIASCKFKALSWDKKNKTIKIDNSKCTSCGSCVRSCEVGAIHVAKNDEEYSKIKKEIDDDPRKIADLFLDRYGAQPILPTFLVEEISFNRGTLSSSKITAVEFFESDSIQCMLKSIPFTRLFKDLDINFCKVELTTGNLRKKYSIAKLPALLFFKDGEMIGKIEGYFDTTRENELIEKIQNIVAAN